MRTVAVECGSEVIRGDVHGCHRILAVECNSEANPRSTCDMRTVAVEFLAVECNSEAITIHGDVRTVAVEFLAVECNSEVIHDPQ